MDKAIRILLPTSLVVGALASVIGLLAIQFPYWELANHFRPFILLGVMVLLFLAFAQARLSSRLSKPPIFFNTVFSKMIGFLLFLIGFNFLLLLPGLFNQAQSVPMATELTKRVELKIMSFNIWVGNTNMAQVAGLIKRENPDVFVLQEFTQKQYQQLQPSLKMLYPYHYSCAHKRSCLMALFSKKPWLNIRHINRNAVKWSDGFPDYGSEASRKIARVNPPLIEALFQSGAGQQPFYLLATHISWPFHPYRQVKDINWLQSQVSKIKADVILAGDMNLSPWSWKLYKLQQKTGLKRHTTFLHSWPANRVKPFVQLDHILTTPSIKAISVKTGSYAGSDHLPVIARLSLP